MKKYVIGLLLILSVTAVGCNQQMTVEEANAAFCENLQAFDDSLTNLDTISATSTVGELKEASAQVDEAWNQVTKSAKQLNQVKLDTIDETWKNLRRTINQVNDDDTLAAVAINVGVSVKEIRASYGLIGDVDCPNFVVGSSTQEPASDAQPAEPAGDSQPAEAIPTEPVAPGFTGTYSTTLTLPDAPSTIMVLVLHEDGTAIEVTRSLEQNSENRLVGQWQDSGDGTASVTLTESIDKQVLATPIVYVFRLEGDQLIAVDFDATVYGPDGFSLQRTQDPAVLAEAAAMAAQASSGITTTAPLTASETVTDAAPIIVIPPATATEMPAPSADASPAAEQVAPASPLDGTWQLQQISQTSGVNYTPDDPGLYTVTFKADGAVSVTADCNSGVGTYQAGASGTLSIQLTSTNDFCASGSLSNQFISYLKVANSYTVDGNALSIGFSSNNGLMTFTAAP